MTGECARAWRFALVGVFLASCLGCGPWGEVASTDLSTLSGTEVTADLDSGAGPFPRDVGEIRIRNDYSESVEVLFSADAELVRPDPVTLGPGETAVIGVQVSQYFAGERQLSYTVNGGTGVIGGGQIVVRNTGGGTAGGVDVFFDRGGEIWAVALDGSASPQPVLQLPGVQLEGVGVNASGDQLLFSHESGDLWRAESDGNPAGVERSAPDLSFQMPAFLDDTAYAWSQEPDSGDADISYVNAAGSALQLTGIPENDGNNDYDPSFGMVAASQVIFFSRHDATNTTSDIYRVSLDGTGLTAVAADGSLSEDHPSYSEANALIVFERAADDASRDDIWVMRPDGMDPGRVTTDEGFDNDDPVWSPDGRWIVWEQSPADNASVNRIVRIGWPLQPGAVPDPLTDWNLLDARRPAMKPR